MAYLPGAMITNLPTVRNSLLERGDVREMFGRLGLTEARVLSSNSVDAFISEMRGVTYQIAAKRGLEVWNALVQTTAAGGVGDLKPGSLRRLQESAWLPSRDGTLHMPCELTLSQIAPGFSPDPAVAKYLRMKDSIVEEFAAQIGISLAILQFVIQNPELIDRLRVVKEERSVASRNQNV